MNNELKEFYISQPNIIQDFEEHLSLNDNTRIIFSGPFGTGKTRFINDFFYAKNEKYIPIYIFPVHYSVVSNYDIFELIKYDILFQLLEFEDLFKDNVFKNTFLAEFYIKDQSVQIFEQFLDVTGYIGKPALKFFKHLKKHIEDFEKYREKHSQTDKEKISQYIEKFENTSGIHEQDLFTELIRNGVSLLKKAGKEIVLIIDDLDRIDPDHIFRILNILGAHIEFSNTKNKFDFDKIILICDLLNIQKIYHHKFGPFTDFSGYISKFYSQTVFNYENKSLLEKELDTFFSKLKIIKNEEEVSYFKTVDEREYRDFKFLISSFINHGGLSIKNLSEKIGKQVRIKDNSFSIKELDELSSLDFESINWIKILIYIFGNKIKLYEAIDRCIEYEKSGLLVDNNDSKNKKKSEYLLPLITIYNYKKLIIDTDVDIELDDIIIILKINRTNGFSRVYYSEIIESRNKHDALTNHVKGIKHIIPIFSLLKRFIRLCDTLDII